MQGRPSSPLLWGQRPPALTPSAGDGGVCPAVHGDPVWTSWAGYLSRFLPDALPSHVVFGRQPLPGLPWPPKSTPLLVRPWAQRPRCLTDDRCWPAHSSVVGYVCRAAVPMIPEPGLTGGASQPRCSCVSVPVTLGARREPQSSFPSSGATAEQDEKHFPAKRLGLRQRLPDDKLECPTSYFIKTQALVLRGGGPEADPVSAPRGVLPGAAVERGAQESAARGGFLRNVKGVHRESSAAEPSAGPAEYRGTLF